MKKIGILICAVAMAVFFSCVTTGKTTDKPAMIADLPPFSIGSASTQLEQFVTGKLKEVEMNVIFHPRVNEVVLEFRHELLTYRLYWKQEARQGFIDALSRYQEDFTNKNLTTKSNKTRSAYGKQKIRFDWESFSFTKTYKASPQIDLGYRFKGNAVYFTSYQNAARTENVDSDKVSDSPQFAMYFNRAQAEKLAKLFDQSYLVELVNSGVQESAPLNPNIDIY